ASQFSSQSKSLRWAEFAAVWVATRNSPGRGCAWVWHSTRRSFRRSAGTWCTYPVVGTSRSRGDVVLVTVARRSQLPSKVSSERCGPCGSASTRRLTLTRRRSLHGGRGLRSRCAALHDAHAARRIALDPAACRRAEDHLGGRPGLRRIDVVVPAAL